jgi:hypothetical protein
VVVVVEILREVPWLMITTLSIIIPRIDIYRLMMK